MKKVMIYLSVFLVLAACSLSGWSLVESGHISKIPLEYKNYNSGIIKDPSQKDIAQALDLGKSSSNSRALEYAYLQKNALGDIIVYTSIYTPLRLISEHSKNCTREYNDVDNSKLDYLSKMNAVKIEVRPQYTSINTYYTYAYNEKFFLLRNGKRVPTLKELPALNKDNPFNVLVENETTELQKQIMNDAMQQTQMFTATFNREQKISYCKQLKLMGFSTADIASYSGLPADSVKVYTGNTVSNKEDKIFFTVNDNIYSIDELNKPGVYQIVYRTPQSNYLFNKGDQEIKIPISFAKYK